MPEHLSPVVLPRPVQAQKLGAAASVSGRGPRLRPAVAGPGLFTGMAAHLQRTLPTVAAPLSVAASLQAVEHAARLTQRAMRASNPAAGLAVATLAGDLLAFTGPQAVDALARTAALDVNTRVLLSQLSRRPLESARQSALMGQILGQKNLLLLLQVRLTQLQAINKILLSWGEHLRKLAKLDKIAHERALKVAHEQAHQALRQLSAHFDALGVQQRRDAAGHVRAADARASRATADRLVQAYVPGNRLLQSWPNMSLQSALTLPMAFGVPTQGTPPRLPGRRLYGQAI